MSVQTELPPPPLAFLRDAGKVTRPSPSRLRAFLGARHSVVVEVAILVTVYVAYDAARGIVGGDAAVAVRHARSVAALERRLRVFVEPDVQRALAHVPGVAAVFHVGYDVFHLAVTGGVLVWLYVRRTDAFARVRTTLVATTLLALVGFTVFPTAPPRLAGVGLNDTLRLGSETAHSGLLRLLYNPYAAMPSLHMAFATIAGGSLVAFGRRPWARAGGAAYVGFVAVEVLATGNHFVLDVVSGVGVAALAAAWSFGVTRAPVLARGSSPARVGRRSVAVGPVAPATVPHRGADRRGAAVRPVAARSGPARSAAVRSGPTRPVAAAGGPPAERVAPPTPRPWRHRCTTMSSSGR